jgi:hypothetical protein
LKQYSFITKWQLQAPINDVWNAIYESEDWPLWWKSVKSVNEIEKGDEQGIGSVRVYKMKTAFLYQLIFQLKVTDRSDHQFLKGKAIGDLEGTGSWVFTEQAGICFVECHWHVRTNIAWMNWLAFLLEPVFRYNHTLVMRDGARSLARKLNAALLSC